MKSTVFAIVFMIAAPAFGADDKGAEIEEKDPKKSSVFGKMLEFDEKKSAQEPIVQSGNDDNRDDTSSQYSPSESSDGDEEGENSSEIPEDDSDNAEFDDPTFFGWLRRIIGKTVSSVYLGFVNGVTLGNTNFTEKHGINFGLAATYVTSALCGGVKSPVWFKKGDQDDKRHLTRTITVKKTWLTCAGLLGFFAGRANSQKIAKLFFEK